MNARMVDLDAWREIFSAYRAAHSAIERAFAMPPSDLNGLRVLLKDALEALRRRLPGGQNDLLVPLSFLLDEQILARLSTTELEVSWPLLGRAFGDTDFGGDVFFKHADELLQRATPSPDCRVAEPAALLIQVYLFCLDEGFVGRYASDAAALSDYRSKLFRRLATARPPGAVAAPWAIARAPRPIWQLAGFASLGVTAWLFVLWLVSGRL